MARRMKTAGPVEVFDSWQWGSLREWAKSEAPRLTASLEDLDGSGLQCSEKIGEVLRQLPDGKRRAAEVVLARASEAAGGGVRRG